MWGLFFLLIVQSQAQADYSSMTNTIKQRLVEKPKKDNGKNLIWISNFEIYVSLQ